MTRDAAVITAVGCVSPAGFGAEALWDALVRGEVLGRYHPADDQVPAHRTARAPDGEALEAVLPRRTYPPPSRTTLLALAAAQECWQGAGLGGELDRDRAGCAMSRNFGQHDVVARYDRTLWEKGPATVSGLLFVDTIGNTVLGKVSLAFRLQGPSLLNFGSPLLGTALDILRDGEADVMLAGGVDELSFYALTRVCLGTLAVRSEDPAGPYDAGCRGLVPGEGAAFLLLETPASARARAARVLGCLRGHASVTDSAASSFRRDADDIAECIRRALADAGITPGDVVLVCGAGTRLPALDRAEALALERVFPDPPPLYSCKGALGETWGAAAYVSAISVSRALATGMAPPTAGTTDVGQECRVPVIIGGPRPIDRSGAALVLSLDMSGQDSAYVFTADA